MRFQVDNEYDKLEAVLVHKPGREIDRLNTDNMRRFLFEDIPYLKRMRAEHDAFVNEMRTNGVDVLYLEQLLEDILDDESVRAHVIKDACQQDGVPAIADDLVSGRYFDTPQLVELLFAGLTTDEFAEVSGKRIEAQSFLLPPIPNAYFSRDPAVIVRGVSISSKMHFVERVRETVLTRAVLEHHPLFKENSVAFGGTAAPNEDRPFTVEGGDVLILSSDTVLIGNSERTRSETIEQVAANCFNKAGVSRVYELPIPAERSFMHLDTVFTVIDRGLVLWFAEVMSELEFIHRYETDGQGGARRMAEKRTLLDILAEEFATEVTVVDTGGGSRHFASREQRTDGTNVFAIAPRTVVAYQRNERTVGALEDHGVKCICIEGSELVRGLGGPRCMTMPLRRASA